MTREEAEFYEDCRRQWREDPVLYVRVRFGINPTRQQEQLLEAIAPFGAQVSCRAGHGVGKTTVVSMAIAWHTECFDHSKTPCTAPTAAQLHSVLWSELSKTLRRAEEQADRLRLAPEFRLSSMFRLVRGRFYDLGKSNEWGAVARTSRREKPDALQGFHASDIVIRDDGERQVAIERSDAGGSIMFVVEEASGVPDEIFEVVEGALSSHRVRLLMVGNPTRSDGFFARSHLKDRAMYTTLHFTCAGSPLAEPDYRAKLVRKYGEGSNVVRVRADGEFPRQDDDVLISLDLTEPAITRDVPPDDGSDLLMGVDVARYGSDRTVILLRKGNRVLAIWVRAKQDTMETAGQVKAIYDSLEVKPKRIKIDVIGIGSGVVDRLQEQGLPVDGVNVAESATMPTLPTRVRRNVRGREARFERQDALPRSLRDWLWFEVKDWLAYAEPTFAEVEDEMAREDLAGELASVRYRIHSDGRLEVESKDMMKRRGLRSPDLAEALLMTFAPDNTASIWEKL